MSNTIYHILLIIHKSTSLNLSKCWLPIFRLNIYKFIEHIRVIIYMPSLKIYFNKFSIVIVTTITLEINVCWALFNSVTNLGQELYIVCNFNYLVICVIVAALKGNTWGIVSSAIYGASVIALFTMSSVYHGLNLGMAKKVLQVLDHCTIYFMIAGTYTPIALCAIREVNTAVGWTLFGVIWGFAIICVITLIVCAITMLILKKKKML